MKGRVALAAALLALVCNRVRADGRAAGGGGRAGRAHLGRHASRRPASGYGYRGVATPALDALARDSIVFENAYCQAPLTLPSHATLLTGLLPSQHGVRDNVGYRLAPPIRLWRPC